MKFNGRLSILAAGVILLSLTSSVMADTLAVTIEKWTANFGAPSASTGPMVVNDDDAVATAGGFIIPTFDADPFYVSGPTGPLDITVIFGLDGATTTESLLSSNVDVQKHSSTDTAQYWLKVFVQKAATSAPYSDGFPYPSGSPISATTTYAQTTGSGVGNLSIMKSSIKDSGGSSSLGSASIPNGSVVVGSANFTRTDAEYNIVQEYDIHLDATKGAHAEVHMSTTTVPEPVTIVSTLIGLVPLGFMVRSFRRRKSDA